MGARRVFEFSQKKDDKPVVMDSTVLQEKLNEDGYYVDYARGNEIILDEEEFLKEYFDCDGMNFDGKDNSITLTDKKRYFADSFVEFKDYLRKLTTENFTLEEYSKPWGDLHSNLMMMNFAYNNDYLLAMVRNEHYGDGGWGETEKDKVNLYTFDYFVRSKMKEGEKWYVKQMYYYHC